MCMRMCMYVRACVYVKEKVATAINSKTTPHYFLKIKYCTLLILINT